MFWYCQCFVGVRLLFKTKLQIDLRNEGFRRLTQPEQNLSKEQISQRSCIYLSFETVPFSLAQLPRVKNLVLLHLYYNLLIRKRKLLLSSVDSNQA